MEYEAAAIAATTIYAKINIKKIISTKPFNSPFENYLGYALFYIYMFRKNI